VEELDSGWIGHFGVNNPNPEAVDVPVGPLNRFQPTPEDRGQPTSFDPGTVEELFTVPFEEAELTWQLDGNGATASEDSPRCEGPTPTPTPTPEPVTTVTTIAYEYDPLYRLTAANYSSGEFIHYAYDAVGNRLTQTTHAETNSYTYDAANRLISVDGVTYSWDEKGNLLNDGTRTFTYNHANRLTSVVINGDSFDYAYNGLGDRLEQTINGVSENYTLGLAQGLTQVLAVEDTQYLYGLGRIGQTGAGGTQYHLGDALGSVRQVSAAGLTVNFAQSYRPYGDPLQFVGQDPTSFGFTGEWTDDTGLMHLRARYYNPTVGRFFQEDTWKGDENKPISYNFYSYASDNPANLTDPSGHDPWWCEGRVDEALCQAKWILQHGGELSSDLLRSVFGHSPAEALMLLQQEYNILIPPGYQFRFAIHTSGVLPERGRIYGVGFWFWEINWPAELDPTLLEISTMACIFRTPMNPADLIAVEYGIFITEYAFEDFGFRPDDVAATLLHEAVHAWQEHLARSHVVLLGAPGDVSSLEWFIRHQWGIERQASDVVLSASDQGRLDLSFLRKAAEILYKIDHLGGPEFPFDLPSGVP
jgi:RHS repeat-associated protein